MSMLQDKHFINAVSNRLDKFKWRSDKKATCRCPLCGDSQKYKNKCRGEFFVFNKQFLFKCHNCGECKNVNQFLEIMDIALWRSYNFESFVRPAYSITPTPTAVDPSEDKDVPTEHPTSIGTCCSDLSDDHPARQFLNNRGITGILHKNFYHCPDFGKLMNFFGKTTFGMVEERLVIPFYKNGKFIGVQGRSYEKEPKIKYITLKREDIDKLIYNYDNVDFNETVYVTEGPIDSMFLPNAIAMQGVSNMKFLPDEFLETDRVFVVDNQPRNHEVCSVMERLLKEDEKVVVWPDVPEKDINAMVVSYGQAKTVKMVEDYTCQGLYGLIALAQWRKCGIMNDPTWKKKRL